MGQCHATSVLSEGYSAWEGEKQVITLVRPYSGLLVGIGTSLVILLVLWPWGMMLGQTGLVHYKYSTGKRTSYSSSAGYHPIAK